MDQRILDLERTVEELSEEVRYLRGEVARLRRLVPGGASGNTPFSSPAGGRDRSDEAAVNASYSDSSYSVISQPVYPPPPTDLSSEFQKCPTSAQVSDLHGGSLPSWSNNTPLYRTVISRAQSRQSWSVITGRLPPPSKRQRQT